MDDVCLAMVISSNACLDVLAVHDDAVARSHRTTVPCSVDGGPCARKEPAAEWGTCLHRIALVVEHPGRRVAIVEVRMVATRGVMSPVPREYVFRVAREPCPRELPARVNLLERRTRVESAERDDVDVPEPCPSGQLGVGRRRYEVRMEKARMGQDNAIEEVVAIHLLEHLPDTIRVMEELHRITRDRATVTIEVPHYKHSNAYKDPTHVRFFTEGSFDYFGADERSYYTHARFRVANVQKVYEYHVDRYIRRPFPRILPWIERYLDNTVEKLVFTLVSEK